MDAAERKTYPLATGVLDYFPDALMEVAHLSKVGNDQHNPGQPLHWAKEKSTDHADALLRHLKDRGSRDSDGERHSAKVAWRALANLQMEIENERKAGQTPAAPEAPKSEVARMIDKARHNERAAKMGAVKEEIYHGPFRPHPAMMYRP